MQFMWKKLIFAVFIVLGMFIAYEVISRQYSSDIVWNVQSEGYGDLGAQNFFYQVSVYVKSMNKTYSLGRINNCYTVDFEKDPHNKILDHEPEFPEYVPGEISRIFCGAQEIAVFKENGQLSVKKAHVDWDGYTLKRNSGFETIVRM